MSPVVTMERVEIFSACHRLHSKNLSDEENAKTFGKCNHVNGHGHNYVWRVKLKGEVDQVSGMVYDLAALKREMAAVLDQVDHRNLDVDVAFFKDNVSTSENVAIFLFHELQKHMSKPHLLHKVTVEETSKNIFSYKG